MDSRFGMAGHPAPSPAMRTTLRLEGAALGLGAIAAFAFADGPWWLFALLVLAPDLAMLGYLGGSRTGAIAYNAAHHWAGPVVLGVVGIGAGSPPAWQAALIWAAHIGLDRALGYGLKYASAFHATHLGPIGRGRF